MIFNSETLDTQPRFYPKQKHEKSTLKVSIA